MRVLMVGTGSIGQRHMANLRCLVPDIHFDVLREAGRSTGTEELGKVEDSNIKRVSQFKFLDRYGEVGEFMRLELKLCLRNKAVKHQVRMGFILMPSTSTIVLAAAVPAPNPPISTAESNPN